MEADLFSFDNRGTGCYQYLFNKLNASLNDFKQNRVGFISFNYDRSLEHFLFTSLQNTYNKSNDECAALLGQIPIIHVHGSLGKLQWQDSKGIPYGTLETYTLLNVFNSTMALLASKQIKVIAEDQSTSEEFKLAFKLLSEAERIYFLGFAYHPTSMERLGVQKIKRGSLMYEGSRLMNSPLMGTCLGMEKAEISFVQEKWNMAIPDNMCDSLLFLRRYANLD